MAAALLVAAVAGVLHTRPFLLSRLVITGLRQATPAEVEADLALPEGSYTWQLRTWVLARRIEADPLISHASFRILWPNGLLVAVTERTPAALLQDGGTAWEVTAGGLLLRALPDQGGAAHVTAQGLPPELPLIAGVHLTAPTAGTVVPGPAVRRALRVAQALGGTVGKQISEVTVDAAGSVGVLTSGGVPADYGNGAQASLKTEELLGILSCARSGGVTLTAIDLAAPLTPAVRTKAGGASWKPCPLPPSVAG